MVFIIYGDTYSNFTHRVQIIYFNIFMTDYIYFL